MSPAAKELMEAHADNAWTEERLLVQVAIGKLTARTAAKLLTPWYMDRNDSGVMKIERAVLEDFEFYRDLVSSEQGHDKGVLLSTAKILRRKWDRT